MKHRSDCSTPVVSHDLCQECNNPICEGDEGLEILKDPKHPKRWCGDCYVNRCSKCGGKLAKSYKRTSRHTGIDFWACEECEHLERTEDVDDGSF
jgi:hypothetical protein